MMIMRIHKASGISFGSPKIQRAWRWICLRSNLLYWIWSICSLSGKDVSL